MDSGISHSQIPSNTEYENLVELNYQLYNGLFLTLPLDGVQQTGLLLPLTMNGVRARVGAVLDDKVGTNAAANPLLATLRAATTAKIEDRNTVMALSL